MAEWARAGIGCRVCFFDVVLTIDNLGGGGGKVLDPRVSAPHGLQLPMVIYTPVEFPRIGAPRDSRGNV